MFEEPHVAKRGKALTFDQHVLDKCQLFTLMFAWLSLALRNVLRTMLAVNTHHRNIVPIS